MQNRFVLVRLNKQTLNVRSLSAIIICRFHLDLQRQNAHPNSNANWSLPTLSIGSFHAASRRMHEAVMAEFGDPPATVENEISLNEFLSQTEGTSTTRGA
jgi:hypothetical protein